MNFQHRLNLVLAEVMGAREYVPPSNVGQLLADFYLLEQIKAAIYSQNSLPMSPELENQLVREVEYLQRTLPPYLRQHLLEKAGYSIACELRHFYNYTIIRNVEWGSSAWGLDGKRALLLKYGLDESTAEYLKQCEYRYERPEPGLLNLKQLHDCAVAGLKAFRNTAEIHWSEGYGGKPWVVACEVWLQLYDAKSLPGQVQWIDQLYSVEHNSGELLNKNEEYQGGWLKTLQELKKHSDDMEDLIPYASPYMRRVALFVNKARYGKTWEASGKEHRRLGIVSYKESIEITKQVREALINAGFYANYSGVNLLRVGRTMDTLGVVLVGTMETTCTIYQVWYDGSGPKHLERSIVLHSDDKRLPQKIVVLFRRAWVRYQESIPLATQQAE